MKKRFVASILPLALALGSASAVAQEAPSPMCHNYAVICSSNYVALGYASPEECWAGMTANLYCPPQEDGPVNVTNLYNEYLYSPTRYCVGRVDCEGGGGGPSTPEG